MTRYDETRYGKIHQDSLVALWGAEASHKVVTEALYPATPLELRRSLEVVIYTPLLNQGPTWLPDMVHHVIPA